MKTFRENINVDTKVYVTRPVRSFSWKRQPHKNKIKTVFTLRPNSLNGSQNVDFHHCDTETRTENEAPDLKPPIMPTINKNLTCHQLIMNPWSSLQLKEPLEINTVIMNRPFIYKRIFGVTGPTQCTGVRRFLRPFHTETVPF